MARLPWNLNSPNLEAERQTRETSRAAVVEQKTYIYLHSRLQVHGGVTSQKRLLFIVITGVSILLYTTAQNYSSFQWVFCLTFAFTDWASWHGNESKLIWFGHFDSRCLASNWTQIRNSAIPHCFLIQTAGIRMRHEDQRSGPKASR
jgi:hypothetical protein